MTSGTRTLDGRSLVRGGCGSTLAGPFFTKTWSGADYPRTKPSYSKTFETFSYVKRKKVKVWYGRFYIWEMRDVEITSTRVRRDYKKPPKRARVEEHAYSCNWTNFNDPLFQWFDGDDPHRTGTFQSCWGGPGIGSSTWDANDEIALIGKLREKVMGSDFTPSVFLAEAHKSVRMIFDAATRIGKAWRFAQKGNFIAAERALLNGTGRQNNAKDGAGNWLQLQYGWKPLLSDAKAGAEYLAHQTSAPFQNVVRVSKMKQEPPVTLGSPRLASKDKYGYTRKSIKCILKEVNSVSLSGLTDPSTAIWEIIPYSFVLDWFIPIQDYLDALNVARSIKGTFVISTKYVKGFRGLQGIHPNTLFNSPATRWEVGSFSRVISQSLSVPTPTVKPLGKALSTLHVANAIALLAVLPRDMPDTPANPKFKPLRLGNGTIKGGHWKLASRGI